MKSSAAEFVQASIRTSAPCRASVVDALTGPADSVDESIPASTPAIIELILKDRSRLHLLLRQAAGKAELASRFLAISLTAFALYGLAMSLTLGAAGYWPKLVPIADWLKHSQGSPMEFRAAPIAGQFLQGWMSGQTVHLTVAYAFGLIATSGICLPSLYFYGLLSGLRLSMSDVVLHSLKGTAVTAVALIGILPVYAVFALGALVFPVSEGLIAMTLVLGLCLPFVAGLWGTHSLFVGFTGLCNSMPEPFRAQRACFVRRLVLSWCACYTAVAPVMIYSVWQSLGG
jgi:hypothetical protein